jgi:hypothetical protein
VAKLAATRQDFANLEKEGGLPAASGHPLHMVMVMKEDGTWRSCGDYRRLNLIIKSDT